MTGKLDVTRSLDAYQAPRGGFLTVDVPDLQDLMIDGHGDPNTQAEVRTILRQPVVLDG